jgi:hypothetical protein
LALDVQLRQYGGYVHLGPQIQDSLADHYRYTGTATVAVRARIIFNKTGGVNAVLPELLETSAAADHHQLGSACRRRRTGGPALQGFP